MAFRSKLARRNCCEQVMPVPVIPVCAIPCAPPKAICEIKTMDPSSLYPYDSAFAIQSLQPCPVYATPVYPQQCPCDSTQNSAQNSTQTLYSQNSTTPIVARYYSLTLNPSIGDVIGYPFGVVPTTYLYCDGAEVSRTTYANLFSIIGTQNGIGDGVTTFNIPDLTDYNTMTTMYIIKI